MIIIKKKRKKKNKKETWEWYKVNEIRHELVDDIVTCKHRNYESACA